MKSKIFQIIYRALIIIFSCIGIFTPNENGMVKQLWYFTLQTNIFIIILCLVLIASDIVYLCKKPVRIGYSKAFSIIRLLCTFFITITGFIYCFILAPGGIIKGMTVQRMLSFREICLHAIVPIMAIVDYIIFCPKGHVSYKNAIFFLIYPLAYFLIIVTRAAFGGASFDTGSPYPYFFIDPTFNNQGWFIVFIYIAVIILLFYSLALLYIKIDKKLYNKSIAKIKVKRKNNSKKTAN